MCGVKENIMMAKETNLRKNLVPSSESTQLRELGVSKECDSLCPEEQHLCTCVGNLLIWWRQWSYLQFTSTAAVTSLKVWRNTRATSITIFQYSEIFCWCNWRKLSDVHTHGQMQTRNMTCQIWPPRNPGRLQAIHGSIPIHSNSRDNSASQL